MRNYLAFITSAVLVATCVAGLARADDEAVRRAAVAAKEKSKSYQGIIVPDHLKKGGKENAAARAAFEATEAPEFKARVDAEKKRLAEGALGISEFAAHYGDLPVEGGQEAGKGDKQPAPRLAADERVYIFISSSMPEATLRAYAASIDRLGDRNIVMVLRGFVGGATSLLPTATFISKVLFKDVTCRGEGCPTFNTEVIIDPELYRRYRPQAVPAVVYAKGVRPFDPDRSEGNKENTPSASNWWMAYGDASLGHVLKVLDREAKTGKLEKMAKFVENRGK